MTRVYHGTTMLRAAAIARDGLSRGEFGIVYVTENEQLAARYANAQTMRTVDVNAVRLEARACVLVFDADCEIDWLRRPTCHASLDVCEACVRIDALRLVEIVASIDDQIAAYASRGCERYHAREAAYCHACAARRLLADPRTRLAVTGEIVQRCAGEPEEG